MKITKFLKIMRDKPILYHKFTNLVELLLVSLSESDMYSPKIVENEETSLYKIAINTLEDSLYSNITVEKCKNFTKWIRRFS